MFFLLLLVTGTAGATDLDTLKVVDVEEVVVIGTPKETRKLRELPHSVSLLSQQDMQAAHISSIKKLTGVIPNMFIPDYGSRLTSAVYIRGIGSRINTPSVGLYVDNIPYVDKSAFDFSYADVERIDVLRGPQGTLYGRNAMGGLIRVHTKSPFSYQGTDLRLGAATRNAYNASVTHYHRISERFAFSAGGFYEYVGGFFRNAARNNERIDRGQSAGGRLRGIYLPGDNWKVDMQLSYEYSDQGGYPYGLYDHSTGKSAQPAYNERSSYYRNLLNAGVNVERQMEHFTLNAVTGYQWLADRMFLDQDFTQANTFNLQQKQRIHTFSEEITLKSKPGKRWQWTTGAFGFYQSLHTDAPTTFHKNGISSVIERGVNSAFAAIAARPGAPTMQLDINNNELPVYGGFKTPTQGAALFHQSTWNNLLVKGLSATVGLRMDYEHLRMDYQSVSAPTDFNFSLKVQPQGVPRPITTVAENLIANAAYKGKISDEYVQLLPKFALQYEWKQGNNVYATVARGYRSGGYNVQMFSDLVTGRLRNSMMDALAADEKFKSRAAMINAMKKEELPVDETVRYKPEHTWNYEVGAHLNLWDRRLFADLSAFYMDTHDQQISHFAENGLGRVTVNAGKSKSYGGEVSLRAALTEAFNLTAAYGYTYAVFRDYQTTIRIKDKIEPVNYKGHYVPFVPKHTLNVGGEYTVNLRRGCLFDRLVLNANYAAAGRIYWTEQTASVVEALGGTPTKDVSQRFYGTLNGRISLQKGNGQIDFWVRNALNKEYTAFYFESLGNGFMQKGNPVQAGVEIRCRF